MARTLIVVLALVAALGPSTAAAAEPSSASWRLTRTTINGGGGASVSPSGTASRIEASIGQESAVGVSSSFDYVLQSGFWSFQGVGLVPVVLTVTKNAVDPGHPDLSWSGNSAPFVVYGSGDCSDVSSTVVTSTANNDYTDTAPPLADLACYSVFATAPGPIAPVGGVSISTDGRIDRRR